MITDPTTRSVHVSIGLPPEMREQLEPGENKYDDCFCIYFEEADDGEGFTAQCICLCCLAEATEAWLTGASIQEVQALMSKHVDEHNQEGAQ